MSQQLGHTGERPATAFKVADKRPFTCVTPHVDFQSAGFVILLVTARERTGELLLLSEVGPIMGEQRTHCDECSFTAWGEKGNSASA